MATLMSELIRPEIKALSAYHVPDPGKLIKLDAMENPYTLPDDLRQRWLETLADVPLNRYPDPAANALRHKLADYMQVPASCEVLLGNGSDELIQMMAMAVAQPGKKILAPEPGFVMYKMIATFVGMDYVGVPLCEDFSLDMEAMLAAIKQHEPALIFLAYPNNPTGNLFDATDIESIIRASRGLVVVDEAYHPFACTSFMSRLVEFDNLLVMRTVSKMGLAGLRLGLLAGAPRWLNEFDKVRLPYNINVLTQVSALFALEHANVFEQQAEIIRQQRQWLYDELSAMNSITVYPSRANFILLKLHSADATEVFNQLKTQGILIKNLNSAGGMLSNCLRITVGTPQENQSFIRAFCSIVD
ncbi:MAG: histidinol-phosphate transaminase [Gammaproteobacteria bacterium]|nr:MAG: histidinol-phosphate transaminase [Gammaproteobacteria bacterium]